MLLIKLTDNEALKKREKSGMTRKLYIFMAFMSFAAAAGFCRISYSESNNTLEQLSVVAPGAKVEKLAGGFTWAEGPAEDPEGNIFFTDNRGKKIYKWSPDGKVTTFIENSHADNGMFFDKDGTLLSCTGQPRQLVSIDAQGTYTVLADTYDGNPLNSPNDLWVDPKGGIYFTDPFWGREQGRDHVHYLTPDRKKLILVNDDMFNPNGIIGTPDGKLLYVSNYIENKTYVFTINADGTLSNKKLFAPEGDDGMTIDTEGNVYLTGKAITVYDPSGKKIDTIKVPETPANVIFCGKDKQKLFITARTSIYSVRMRTKGL